MQEYSRGPGSAGHPSRASCRPATAPAPTCRSLRCGDRRPAAARATITRAARRHTGVRQVRPELEARRLDPRTVAAGASSRSPSLRLRRAAVAPSGISRPRPPGRASSPRRPRTATARPRTHPPGPRPPAGGARRRPRRRRPGALPPPPAPVSGRARCRSSCSCSTCSRVAPGDRCVSSRLISSWPSATGPGRVGSCGLRSLIHGTRPPAMAGVQAACRRPGGAASSGGRSGRFRGEWEAPA